MDINSVKLATKVRVLQESKDGNFKSQKDNGKSNIIFCLSISKCQKFGMHDQLGECGYHVPPPT